MIDEAIAEKLDVEKLFSTSNTFRVADLGCSVGPNTFFAMQKYRSLGHHSRLPEFQVLFNDHANNDFNTLFTSLPPGRQYFATGVPGSFHGRLFPDSLVHIMHSSYALQWLSKVPEEVQDIHSPAWNKGRIYYTSAPKSVAEAYAAQFAKDMDNFLNIRAKEIVDGGMMILVMITIPDGIQLYQIGSGVMYDVLGCCLMDMAKAGMISEALVDSFNLPVYTASLKEAEELIQRNGCFSIEKMKATYPLLRTDDPIDIHKYTAHLRAAVEGTVREHFGDEIIEELFDRYYHKLAGYDFTDPNRMKGTLLMLALKRK